MNDSTQSAASESGVTISKAETRSASQTQGEGASSGAAPTTSAMSAATVDKSERNWAVAAHLSGLSLYLGIPFGNILGPLVVWLIKKGESPYAEQQAKEALNFQISLTLYGVVAVLLAFVFVGFLLIPALFVLQIVLSIMATVRASEGKAYEYPLTLRLIS